ncbi:MAG: cytochrome c oxidase subunit 3 family protein [Gemmatimonadota bacterium]|nr:cytochrome c oxidase subunit 3 family protein [Gemmatimonadota bacterium]
MGDATHGHASHVQHHFDSPKQQMESGKLGMWLFLAQELLFFGGVFCVYAIFRARNTELFEFGSGMLNWKMGAVNTVVLICSSLTMAWAVRCAQIGARRTLLWMLVATQLFAGAFLVVKYVEYGEKIDHGLLWGKLYAPDEHVLSEHGYASPHASTPEGADSVLPIDASSGGATAGHAANGQSALVPAPANGHIFFGIYFAMTGLHLLHVLAGMAVIAWLMIGTLRGVYGPQYFNPVDIVGLYWHLVDLIWIFLFPLLYLI